MPGIKVIQIRRAAVALLARERLRDVSIVPKPIPTPPGIAAEKLFPIRHQVMPSHNVPILIGNHPNAAKPVIPGMMKQRGAFRRASEAFAGLDKSEEMRSTQFDRDWDKV